MADLMSAALVERGPGALRLPKGAQLAYLDGCVLHWRGRKVEADGVGDEVESLMAACYVDAFQSVRAAFFGAMLPLGDGS